MLAVIRFVLKSVFVAVLSVFDRNSRKVFNPERYE